MTHIRRSLHTMVKVVSYLSLILVLHGSIAFQVHRVSARVSSTHLFSETETKETKEASSTKSKKTKTLGLLTFDLDDTLYPIAPVVDEANAAFARAMDQFGFSGIKPNDIVETGRKIREEIAARDPIKAATLTHTEIRRLAIRREMERITLERKLQATADDWATPVASLSPVVVKHAKK